MNRRTAIRRLATFILAAASVAHAQQPKKIPRIGIPDPGTHSSSSARIRSFGQGLRELGYIEGQNIIVEHRFAEGKLDRLPGLVAELVRLKVDVIVTGGGPPTQAAKNATHMIPIVMVNISDPVAIGFAASLARPGGNITGLSSMQDELGQKRLELLKEVVPKISRAAVLVNRDVPGYGLQMKSIEDSAQALGLRLLSVEVRGPEDLEGAFSAITKGRGGAVIGLTNPTLNILQGRIAELAVRNRLASMMGWIEYPEAGGLMSYGPQVNDLFRRAAWYVDKILKGTNPADLPVERPMKFEFVINKKTADQIGLTIPQWTLMKADKVIR